MCANLLSINIETNKQTNQQYNKEKGFPPVWKQELEQYCC